MHIERVTQSMNLLKRMWFNGNDEAKRCLSQAMTVTFKSSPMFYSDKRCASFTQMTFYDVWWIYVSNFKLDTGHFQMYRNLSLAQMLFRHINQRVTLLSAIFIMFSKIRCFLNKHSTFFASQKNSSDCFLHSFEENTFISSSIRS